MWIASETGCGGVREGGVGEVTMSLLVRQVGREKAVGWGNAMTGIYQVSLAMVVASDLAVGSRRKRTRRRGRGVDAMNEQRPGTGSKKNEEKKMCNMG